MDLGRNGSGRREGVSGVLNVDKPSGPTSHDVVARVRRLAGQRRVGHAGTLDPLATGVLVVCLGKATRLVEYLTDLDKVYRATIRLGVTTDTWDVDGEVLEERDAAGISREDVAALLPEFQGRIAQVPPMYSALKRGGQPLYRLARQGISVEREPREVEIHALTLEAWSPPEMVLHVRCGKGAYIRSLAHDLGQRLGVGAHIAALRRLAVGHFSAGDAVALEDLEAAGEGWTQRLLSPAVALRHLPSVVLDAEDVRRAQHGGTVVIDAAPAGALVCAYDGAGRLIAMLRPADGTGAWRPDKVLESAG